MKKITKLLILGILPLGLISCGEDEQVKPTNALGRWFTDDVETMKIVDENIVLPYYNDLFKAYEKVLTEEEQANPELKDKPESSLYNANYSVIYNDDVDKVVVTVENGEENITLKYKDFCLNETKDDEGNPVASKWTLNEDAKLPINSYRLYQKLSETKTYYLDIIQSEVDLKTINITAYVREDKNFSSVIDAFNYINNGFGFDEGCEGFIAPSSNAITKVNVKNDTHEASHYFDVTIYTSDANELANYRNYLLNEKEYIDDIHNERKGISLFYKIENNSSEDYKFSYDVFIPKLANQDNSFKLVLTAAY